MKAVQDEGMTVSGASKQFSVPRKTLYDRIKGRVKHGCKPGPCIALTAEEESALTANLLYMAEHGFPLTSNMAMGFAWAVSICSGTQHRSMLTQDLGSTGGEAFIRVILNSLSTQLIILSVVERMP